jgi:ribonucleoside-diphosphate reductase beta chain
MNTYRTDIFAPRHTIKPYEYPELIEYAQAIIDSHWQVKEFQTHLKTDMLDFNTKLTPVEQEAVKRAMLAISHVEHAVKTFWARLDMRMDKPEISFVGSTFAGNEVVHSFAYAELLKQLGLDEDFYHLMEIPAIADRTKYLKKYLEGMNSRSNKEFTKSLILFTLLVENVSLFSQFLIISSFSKYHNKLKTIHKIINATAREEIIHGKFGSQIVNIIKRENPDWFDQEMEDKIRRNARKAFQAEMKVLDWVFEKGELDFIPRSCVNEFLKLRFNDSLQLIGYNSEFETDSNLLSKSDYLTNMLTATADFDFFDQRSVDYSKGSDYNEDSLFD